MRFCWVWCLKLQIHKKCVWKSGIYLILQNIFFIYKYFVQNCKIFCEKAGFIFLISSLPNILHIKVFWWESRFIFLEPYFAGYVLYIRIFWYFPASLWLVVRPNHQPKGIHKKTSETQTLSAWIDTTKFCEKSELIIEM